VNVLDWGAATIPNINALRTIAFWLLPVAMSDRSIRNL
jgi:hypothetical protein